MNRVEWALALLITALSIALVTVRYHERRLYVRQYQEERVRVKLEAQREQLRVELTQLARADSIETIALEKLRMVPIRPPDIDHYPLRTSPELKGGPQ